MILVDTALEQCAREGRPIRVGLVGAGFSARNLAYHILTCSEGIQLVGIANRTIHAAAQVFERAGVSNLVEAESLATLDSAIDDGKAVVTSHPDFLCESSGVDVIIESTGTIDFAAGVVLHAINNKKHVVLLNIELDATIGPLLKAKADDAGVIYTNTDGDEPGVAMNIVRFVRSIGLQTVVAGNLKGFYDRYRNPLTQQAFAKRFNQDAQKVASFADGTKLSMELAVLANALEFGVARRGMYGPKLRHVNDAGSFFADKIGDAGIVDFLEGADPANGAFVVATTNDPVHQDYLKYLKMGDGPLYVFHTPFHLPQLEIANTIGRAALFGDATVAPAGAPSCDALAFAKRDLKKGEVLDGLGGFHCYALIENYIEAVHSGGLPIGVATGCRLRADISKDRLLTYDDVELPHDRLCDRLRTEQASHFAGSTASLGEHARRLGVAT